MEEPSCPRHYGQKWNRVSFGRNLLSLGKSELEIHQPRPEKKPKRFTPLLKLKQKPNLWSMAPINMIIDNFQVNLTIAPFSSAFFLEFISSLSIRTMFRMFVLHGNTHFNLFASTLDDSHQQSHWSECLRTIWLGVLWINDKKVELSSLIKMAHENHSLSSSWNPLRKYQSTSRKESHVALGLSPSQSCKALPQLLPI